MFYYLHLLRDIFFGFNIFRYISFRTALASITSFILCVILGSKVIRFLSQYRIVEEIRDKENFALHEQHASKKSIPTMGGIFILSSIVISTLLWADIFNKYIILALAATVYLGGLGFLDDYLKFKRRNTRGLEPKWKFLAQIFFGLVLGTVLYFDPFVDHHLEFPFFKELLLNLGIFYIFFSALVVVGSSNAVNLTDGLDGLAIGCIIMASVAYTVMSYIAGHARLSSYLIVSYIPGSGELAVFMGTVIGASLGFLWYNCYPASIFMGDTGALALGGLIGTVALIIKKELLLVIVGGIFVMEALSVILQVSSFKTKGKRVFLMAPLHHHFQMKGLSEPKVIVRFWIVAAILALLSLATLKIR